MISDSHPALRWLSRHTVGVLLVAMTGCTEAQAGGRVVDYGNDEPISGATVILTQRGWGRSGGSIVWDKAYTTVSTTDAGGSFKLSMPAPRPFAGSGTLTVEAPGWQRLVGAPVSAGSRVRLQTLPVPAVTIPGGIAHVGLLEDGRYFGWSFVNDAPTLDPDQADILPTAVSHKPLTLSLTARGGGGVLFVSRDDQRIAGTSYGDLLRYMNEAPPDGYQPTLDLGVVAGTVVVRTAGDRYAKLAFDPRSIALGSGQVVGLGQPVRLLVALPFAYNPRPGRDLTFDPTGVVSPVRPETAGALADLPVDGVAPRTPRNYRITVRDDMGRLVDSLVMTLEPGVTRDAPGSPRSGGPRLEYRNVLLNYGSDGLPRVKLSIDNEHFIWHGVPVPVGRSRSTVLEFEVYAPAVPARRFELHLQEVH